MKLFRLQLEKFWLWLAMWIQWKEEEFEFLQLMVEEQGKTGKMMFKMHNSNSALWIFKK